MIWPIIVVVVGLALTLAGLFLTLKHEPPEVDFSVEWEKSVERSLMTIPEIKSAGEKAVRKEKFRIELSKAGVRLLLYGTALQLIGTVWQVVRLAC